jgi:pilus assembly protein Flp/PilA
MRQTALRRSGWRPALRLAADESGTSAIEYSILAAGIAVAIIAVVFQIGDAVKTNFYDKLLALF